MGDNGKITILLSAHLESPPMYGRHSARCSRAETWQTDPPNAGDTGDIRDISCYPDRHTPQGE